MKLIVVLTVDVADEPRANQYLNALKTWLADKVAYTVSAELRNDKSSVLKKN